MAAFGKSTIVRIIIYLEVSLLISATFAMPDYGDVISGSTKRFCGRMLSDALALICNNEYGTLISPTKRSDESFDEYAYNDQPSQLLADPIPLAYERYAYISKLTPENQIRARVRREWSLRHGAYDQCCRKPCSVQELQNYCKKKIN